MGGEPKAEADEKSGFLSADIIGLTGFGLSTGWLFTLMFSNPAGSSPGSSPCCACAASGSVPPGVPQVLRQPIRQEEPPHRALHALFARQRRAEAHRLHRQESGQALLNAGALGSRSGHKNHQRNPSRKAMHAVETPMLPWQFCRIPWKEQDHAADNRADRGGCEPDGAAHCGRPWHTGPDGRGRARAADPAAAVPGAGPRVCGGRLCDAARGRAVVPHGVPHR